MKIMFPAVSIALTLLCCTQTSDADKRNLDSSSSSMNKNRPTLDSSSLTIFKKYFVFSFRGNSREVQTQKQLSQLLEKEYNTQDSLYIFVEDTSSDQMAEAMKAVHDSEVAKYRIIVRNEFFKLPYPDQK